ncbi:MAG TPA: peptidyl-prolyl cis-trans isomerase [Chthoniobacterales bacterium]|jgi:peptidyl-prolyl cis-trans isomerase D|nr:peptidyl-prolyl cis-trans isomerase [Chthoniobacterales bacterium]
MIKILRKHRNWLMIVIAILALPFCLYFVKSDTSLIRSDNFVQMYGRKVTMTEAHRDARLFQLSQLLGMSDLRDGLAPGSGTDDQKAATFIINLIVLRHESERLGIEPAESEIVEAVKNFPALQGASGFDAAKYDQVERTILPSFGFADEQLRELARDELCLKRIKKIVASGVSLPESESKSNYEQLYGKNLVSVVRVRSADLLKEIKVSDDDIKKYYEAHKTELKTEEKRKVEFVRLALSEEQKKLKDKQRIDALQKLADRANDFSQALLEKGADFHQVAARFQLPVETTGEFTMSAPDPKLKADPQLNQAAFRLTPQEPNSDPLQSADGFAILHLAGVVEARPLTLDEAKQKIVDQIKNERAREMAIAKGRKAAETLRNGLKVGQPLQFTLEQAGGLKAEKLEPFTVADDADAQNPPEKPKNEPADMMMIKNVSAQLQPGEVSDFVPWIDGGLIVLMDKREPPDPAKYQQTRATFEERYLKTAREYVFMEWLRDRQRDAGLLQSAKG